MLRARDVDRVAERGPVRWVLISAAMQPFLMRPIQAMRYSGRFSISSETTSPLRKPCALRPAREAVGARVELGDR